MMSKDPICSISASARPSNFSFAHCRRGGGLEQLMPVLLADKTTRQHVVTVAGHQVRAALAARETLQMEDVGRCARLLW